MTQMDHSVLSASSWHGLADVGTFCDASSAISHGERSGAWPVSLATTELRTSAGLKAPLSAIVATYAAHPDRVVGVNGKRYRATTPEEWRELVTAAVAAGAQPTGSFGLCDGSRVLATFQVGTSNGIRTQFMLADSFDGSLALLAGFTSIRLQCANTIAVALRRDGAGMSALRHTASLESKVKILSEAIGTAIKTGDAVRSTYAAAESAYLSPEAGRKAFDALFPEAPEGASALAQARAEATRCAARRAAQLPINRVGTEGGNVATLWNAATYLVDRTVEGNARQRGHSDRLNSMLFGSRGDRVREIQETIEIVMRDGSIQRMAPREAMDHGCDAQSVGRAILADFHQA